MKAHFFACGIRRWLLAGLMLWSALRTTRAAADPVSFAAWAATIPNSSQRGITNTPLGDGVPNLLKYALGILPMARPTPGLFPAAVRTNGSAVYRFQSAVSACQVTCLTVTKSALNAGAWTPAPMVKTADDGVFETWDTPLIGTGRQAFFQLEVNLNPLLAPQIPTVIPGNGQLTVGWTAVADATSYAVYYSATNNPAAATQFGTNVTSGTMATVTGLANNTPYYVWLIAKNTNGSSAFSRSAAGTPAALVPGVHPRIYLTAAQMPAILRRAGLDATGKALSGVTPADSWTTFADYMAQYRDFGTTYYGQQAWHFALMYMLTKDTNYYARAMDFLTENMTGKSTGDFGAAGAFSPSTSTDPLDYDMNGNGYSVRFDDFYPAPDYVRDAALVYDWFYPTLTAAQRAQIIHYINRIEGEMWDPAGLNPGDPGWSGWALNDPGDNYHYNQYECLSYAAAALAGDDTNQPTLYLYDYTDESKYQSFHDFNSLLQARLAVDLPFLTTTEEGGAWCEGDSYGNFSKSMMMDAFSVLKSAHPSLNLFTNSTFFAQAGWFFLYAAQPAVDGAGSSYSEGIYDAMTGDDPNYGYLMNDADRTFLLQIVDGLGQAPEADYLRAWVAAKYPTMLNYPWQYGLNFLLDQTGQPTINLTNLPPYYYSPGVGWLNSRSSWADDANAVSVNFWSADRIESHQHEDANAFLVYYQEWQIANAVPYLSDVYPCLESKYQSLVLADDAEQRYSYSTTPAVPDLINPTGKILKQESGPGYSYAVGDASDAYYTDVNSYGSGSTRLLNTNIREFVHLRPNLVLLYDRVSPVLLSTPISYQIITHHHPASLNATDIAATNGAGMVFQRTLLPAGATISPVQLADVPGDDCWQTRVKASTAATNVTFFHLLQTANAGTPAMIASSPIHTSLLNGVLVATPTNTAVLFAANSDGAALSVAVSYTIAPSSSTVKHLVCDLVPGEGYTITVTAAAQPVVTVTPGGTNNATASGVLAFATDSHGHVTLP